MIVVLLILAIPSLSLLFLQNRQVQTRVSKMLAEKLSEKLQTTISLSSVNYSFFKRVQVRDLFIEDMHGDTLIYAELTKIRIKQIRPDQRGLEIRKIVLENAWCNLVIDSSNVVNLTYFVNMLKKPHVPPEQKSRLHIHELIMENGRFSLSRMEHPPQRSQIDFNDFDLGGLEISLLDLISEQDTVSMNITSLYGVDRSGFEFSQLSTLMSLGKTHMHFKNLEVYARDSDLQIPELGFNFETWENFKHFSSEVDIFLQSIHSRLQMDDLSIFVPETIGLLDRLTIDGYVHGRLNDLKGNDLQITFNSQSTLAFDFTIIGLPDFKNSFLDFNFKELNSSVTALYEAFSGRDAADHSLYPWRNLGDLDFRGKFTGYPDNFVATGNMQTDMGNLLMDLSFKPDSLLGTDFQGHLSTSGFKLGAFFENEALLSQLDMDVMVDGNIYERVLRADLEGSIDTLDFLHYSYSNITLDGAFTNNTFNGGFSIRDPNIRMDFLGKMDFSGKLPSYNFTADVARSRPYFLKLGVEDPNTFASFLIETNITGNKLDELNGEVRLVNSLFERNNEQVQLYDVQLSAINTPDTSSLEIKSELFDASMAGRFKLSSLPASLRNLADLYMNLIPGKDPEIDSINQFSYEMDLKRINPILDFFFPTLQVGEGSFIRGIYKPALNINSSIGKFSKLEIGSKLWHNVDFQSSAITGEYDFQFNSDSLVYGKSYVLEKQQFHLFTTNDTANLDVTWENQSAQKYSGEINLSGAFQPASTSERGFLVDVASSELYINSESWEIKPSSILFRKNYINVDSLSIKSRDKHILADGTISSEGEHSFNLDFSRLNLHELSGVAGINANLDGDITGNLTYRKSEGNPYIFSNLVVDTLYFNDQCLGPSNLNAEWNESRKNIHMMLQSDLNNTRTIDVDGEFSPANNRVDFDIYLNEFQLKALSPYAESIVEDISGTGDVHLTVDGTLDRPELNGTIGFNEGAATILFLNTRYSFNDPIRVYNNNLYFENFTAFDEHGNSGNVNGSISNSYFHDFYTSIRIEARNLKCMNTRSVDNDVFYGTIFATGNLSLNGSPNDLRIDIDASTNRNTVLYLPLFNAREVQNSDFITFIQKTELEKTVNLPPPGLKGVSMELEVDITEDAVVQLIFDPKVGDIIETSGKGNLRILLDPSQGFRMFGGVELLKGDYLFTLQNVINKRFEIEPGGKINFNGSPTKSTIDLAAIYDTRAAPYNLFPGDPSETESLKKRIPIECHLNLQGELQSPTLYAGIEMPTADPEMRDLLQNATSTEEELMKQFLSLLVINNFYSVSGFGTENMGAMNSSFAGVTASELLSNQLSNWLSQISDDFEIGFNYRPGDQVSSQEVEVALSTQLLNDRMIISGNVDVGGQETNPSSGQEGNPYIMGDFEVEYKITDNVSVLAFNRSRDELIAMTAPYKQGVGVSYREEFNNFKQLMARYREGIARRKERRKKKRNKADSEA